nr:MAG TPA: hypothetical protein [Caudoviricetes sp.]
MLLIITMIKLIRAMINIPNPNINVIAVAIDTTLAFPFLESELYAYTPY